MANRFSVQVIDCETGRLVGEFGSYGVVNQPSMEAELETLHRSVTRSQPYGNEDRVEETARQLGLESMLRSRAGPGNTEL